MSSKKRRAVDRIWKDTDLIGLSVSLKSKTGRSFTEKGVKVTRNNLEYFVPEKQKIREAKQELTKAGFKVIAESRLGLSIVGEKRLIEKYFNLKIGVKTHNLRHGKRTVKIRMPAGDIRVPKKLSGIIDRVKFEQYPIPLESSTPPDVDSYHLNVPDDIADILGASGLHDCGYDGSGIKLCMLDDGFYEHAYYTERGYDITMIPIGLDEMDGNKGHGTAIASNALAIAPDVEFIVMNSMILIFSVAIAAFRRAKEENPDVITCSWGMASYDEDLAWEIADAVNNGIVVVFACGNGGEVLFPGCMDEVISVGGAYPEEDGGFHASTYASSGECADNPGRQSPDVCGLVGDSPHGMLIMMPTVPDGPYDGAFSDDGDGTADDDGWMVASGTSSAAPQVAGIAALMLQCDPTLTPEEVKTILENTATDITAGNSASGEAAGIGVDLATGHGLVNAAAAMEEIGCTCSPCGFREAICVAKAEVLQACLYKREAFGCLYREPLPCLYREPLPCLYKEPLPCYHQLETGPGGCGPISLIANWYSRAGRPPDFAGRRLREAAEIRIMRMLSPRKAGKHVRRLSASRRVKRTRSVGIRRD